MSDNEQNFDILKMDEEQLEQAILRLTNWLRSDEGKSAVLEAAERGQRRAKEIEESFAVRPSDLDIPVTI